MRMINQKQTLSTEKKVFFSFALVIFLGSAIAFLYLGYTVYRSIKVYSYIKSNQRAWKGTVFKADSELGFTHVPDAKGFHVFPTGPDIPMRFDKDGFRSPVGKIPALSDGGPVVLALGCSFTYGDGVYAKDAFPYLVGKSLSGTTKNAGCCSCGLSQMLILARRLVPSHKPDYLIVQFSQWLVERARNPFAPTYSGKSPTPYFYQAEELSLHPPVFLTNADNLSIQDYRETPKGVIDFISFLWNAGGPQFIYDDFHMLDYSFKRVLGRIPQPATDDKKIIKYVYEEIAILAQENGAKLIIVVLGNTPDPLPIPQHLFPSNAIIVDGHGALLKRLPIVNHEYYKKHYAIWRGSPPRIVDTHPNERAHQIIAEEIVSKIQSSGKEKRTSNVQH